MITKKYGIKSIKKLYVVITASFTPKSIYKYEYHVPEKLCHNHPFQEPSVAESLMDAPSPCLG